MAYAIAASANKDFQKPTEGLHQLVLAEIQDLGLIKRTFEGKTTEVDTFKFVFQTAAKDDEGKRFLIFKSYRKSLHPKSNLSKDLTDIFKKTPPESMTEEQVKALIGMNTSALIVINASKTDPKKTFANVKAFMPLAAGTAKIKPEAIEWKKKTDEKKPGSTAITEENPIDSNDIPF